jgi:hypothetical protein
MKITRRNFVQISGMAALSAAVLGPAGKVFGQNDPGSDLFALPADSLADPLNYLSRAHFEPFTGTAFRAGLAGGPGVNLRLKAVTDLTLAVNVKQGFTGESFSLLFESASGRRYAGGTYDFDHGNLGKFTLNLTPVGKSGRNYEAVINRVNR